MSSKVWKYYKKINDKAHCLKCPQILACKGSSTSSLRNHLIKKHQIDVNEISTNKNMPSPDDMTNKPSTSQKNVNKYFKEVKMGLSIEEILSRAVAEDGLSINSVHKSKVIKSYLNSLHMETPSQMTIWKNIFSFYEQKKLEYISIFKSAIERKGKFSITVDEWVDVSNIKYVNVSVRCFNLETKQLENFNLGLQQLTARGTSENIENIVKQKLLDFNIDIDVDVVASTHDGAAVMKKYGESISPISQLCYNHAIHLCVIDSFYKSSMDFEVSDGGCSDSENEIHNSDDSLDISEEKRTLIPSILSTVNKVRKVVKMFKKSHDKNEKFQKYVVKQEGHQIHLKLDVRHRWNSLSIMISEFLKLRNCINHTLLDLNLETFYETEFEILHNILKELEPLAVATNKLSSDTVTLLEADAILKFTLSSTGNSDTVFANNLKAALSERIFQRRNITVNTLIMYLHNGSIPKSCKNLKYSSKTAAKHLAVKLYDRLFVDNMDESVGSESSSGCNEMSSNPMTLEDKLNMTIDSIQTHQMEVNKAESYNLIDDFEYLEKFKKRSEKLNLIYNSLLTINPTSTISERVFSVSSNIKTKVKNRMSPKHLDCILFLKYYFKKN